MSSNAKESGVPAREETKQQEEIKDETRVVASEKGPASASTVSADVPVTLPLVSSEEPTTTTLIADDQEPDLKNAGPEESKTDPVTEATDVGEKNSVVKDGVEPPTAPSSVVDDEDTRNPSIIVTRSSRKRPPYKYDPDKVILRFLFANKDGLTVTIECRPQDTVGEVKGALLSVWPEDLPRCKGGDRLRLICMGKGILTPDSRTLEDCQVPVFKTHATPVNVSVRPEAKSVGSEKHGIGHSGRRYNDISANSVDQGCACVIL